MLQGRENHCHREEVSRGIAALSKAQGRKDSRAALWCCKVPAEAVWPAAAEGEADWEGINKSGRGSKFFSGSAISTAGLVKLGTW